MSIPLRVLVVHPVRRIALNLVMDLRKIGTVMDIVKTASTLNEARTTIETITPHIVILGLNFPNDEALELLKQFPPKERGFVVIFVDDENTPLRTRQRHLEAMIEHQAAGYLVFPFFHNGTLGMSMEEVRNRLQARIVADRQYDVTTRLIQTIEAEVAPPTTIGTSEERPALTAAFSVPVRSVISAKKAPTTKQASTPKSLAKPLTKHPPLETTWSNVIRLQTKENYYELWYFDAKERVCAVLVRKDDLPPPAQMPSMVYQAHRSHLVNMKHIAEVNPKSLLMRCGNSVPLAEAEQERLQTIFDQLSVQMAVLTELRTLLQQQEESLMSPLVEA